MNEPEVVTPGYTVKKAAPVFADPKGDAAPLAELVPGETVVVLSHLGDLLKVRTTAGVEGYVVASAIEVPRPAVERAAAVAGFAPFRFSELLVTVSAALLIVSIFTVRDFVWNDEAERVLGDRRYLLLMPAIMGIVSFLLSMLRFGRLVPLVPSAVVQILLGLTALGAVLLIVPLPVFEVGLSDEMRDYLRDLPWGYLSASPPQGLPFWGFSLAFYGGIGLTAFGILALIEWAVSRSRASA